MNFNRTESMICRSKPKFVQITEGKPKISQILEDEICHEGPKSKNVQITRTKSKKKLQRENQK